MTDANGMNVGKGSQQLVHVKLDLQHRHGLLELGIVATGAVDGFGNIFENKIEVYFVFLGDKDDEFRARERSE